MRHGCILWQNIVTISTVRGSENLGHHDTEAGQVLVSMFPLTQINLVDGIDTEGFIGLYEHSKFNVISGWKLSDSSSFREAAHSPASGWNTPASLGHHKSMIGRDQMGRLIRKAGLRSMTRGKTVRTTLSSKLDVKFPNLVKRNFTATRPNQLSVADITFDST
jgi:hypothetical protein